MNKDLHERIKAAKRRSILKLQSFMSNSSKNLEAKKREAPHTHKHSHTFQFPLDKLWSIPRATENHLNTTRSLENTLC